MREHAYGRCGRAAPFRGDPLHQRCHALREVLGVVAAVDAREGGQEVELVPDGQAPARCAGHGGGLSDVHDRVHGVAQPQFQAGGALVTDLGGQLHPAGGGDDEVDAVVQAAGRELVEGGQQAVEVLLDLCPAVDDQEDVAVCLVRELPAARRRR